MDALPFLASSKATVSPLYVVHGDEAFLKRQVIRAVRKRALGDDNDEQAVSLHAGDKAIFAEVFDELDTVPFFYPKRVVIVENADTFVTKYRADLEKKLTHLPATGVLVLITSASCAVTIAARTVFSRAVLGFVSLIFIYTTLVNIYERPEGLKIACVFIFTMIFLSLVSRAFRSTELRITAPNDSKDKIIGVRIGVAGVIPRKLVGDKKS